MYAPIRNSHEVLKQHAECFCSDPTCGWYGNKDEIEMDEFEDPHCPVCLEDIDFPLYEDHPINMLDIMNLVMQMGHACLCLNKVSVRYCANFEINGIASRIELRVFDRPILNNSEDPDRALNALVVGGFEYTDSTSTKPEYFDYTIFRDWINGVAELLEPELEKQNGK